MTIHKPLALITGGGRGIGRGIGLALASSGWNVAINYLANLEAAEETQRSARQLGAEAALFQADVSQGDARERLVQRVMEIFGRIDLLVNNAGMGPRQRVDLLVTSEASFDEVLQTNLKAPFFLSQRVAREMIALLEKGIIQNPKIINIGSISAYTSSVNRGEYCVSKAGLAMVTRLFADRLAEYGICVYEVRPGIIETDLSRAAYDRYNQLIFEENLTPIRRWGQPEDVGQAVLAIAEGRLRFSTGEIINVDGGFHLRRL
jgi:NAD(P)-dependent dehydrogenase (short-subunit alcohol dehydrogenase family)